MAGVWHDKLAALRKAKEHMTEKQTKILTLLADHNNCCFLSHMLMYFGSLDIANNMDPDQPKAAVFATLLETL